MTRDVMDTGHSDGENVVMPSITGISHVDLSVTDIEASLGQLKALSRALPNCALRPPPRGFWGQLVDLFRAEEPHRYCYGLHHQFNLISAA